MRNSAILLVQCPDRHGIVSAVADLIDLHHGNILHADQPLDLDTKLFLLRVEWDLDGFVGSMGDFSAAFESIAATFQMKWKLTLSSTRQRVAIFVSKFDHCLADLLYRHQTNELYCDIPLIVSNHPDTKRIADFYGIPYHHISVTKDNKAHAEAAQLALI